MSDSMLPDNLANGETIMTIFYTTICAAFIIYLIAENRPELIEPLKRFAFRLGWALTVAAVTVLTINLFLWNVSAWSFYERNTLHIIRQARLPEDARNTF
jgi:hypothetical protein